jgi:putative ABC transport system permease protein
VASFAPEPGRGIEIRIGVKLQDTILIAFIALGRNQLRSALTATGITIGIFSIISVMTAISALQNSIETGLSFLGSDIFQFSKYPVGIQISGAEKYRNRRNIDYGTYLKFARIIGDQAAIICPKVWDDRTQGVFENRKTNPNIQLCGTNEGFLTANNYVLEEGRNLSPEDGEFARSVCVIGRQVAERLFPQGGASGRVIRLDSKEYQVIGILAEKGSGFGGNNDNIVLIPITKFFDNYGRQQRSLNIAVEAPNQKAYERTMGIAFGAFRQARGLRPEEPNDFEIYSNDSIEGVFRSVAGIVRMGAFLVSTIALIAAGIGIMNIMLVSVTERTKEIGIRKSLGARRSDIRMQFLLEALSLSLIGAGAGIFLGIIAGNGLALWLRATAIFPWDWAIIGVVFCSAIGVGFGLYPAHKAASMHPVEALRRE